MKIFENMPNMRKIPNNPLLFIWEALYGARKWALVGVLLAFALQLLKVYVPVFFSNMIEYFSKITLQEFDWNKTWWFLGIIFVTYIGQSLVRTLRELLEENRVRNFMTAKIMLFTVDYLAKHSENYFASQKSGQLSQKALNCAGETARTHALISRLYSSVFQGIISFYFVSCVNLWFLFLIFLFGFISLFASYKASAKLQNLNREADNMFDDFNGVLADSIGNALNIKANGSEEYEISFVKKAFNKCKDFRLSALDKFHNNLRLHRALFALFELSTLLLLIKLWYMQKINHIQDYVYQEV